MYRLIFQSGPQRGRRVGIRQGPVIIGRHPEAALRLPEPEIALQHAQIEDRPGGGAHLRRLASGARVRLNGQEVEAADLHEGDLIEIGPHVLRFSPGTAPAAAPAAEQGGGRRLGVLQGLTLLAVGLLLAGQMIFLVTVSLWRQPSTTAAAAVPPPPPAPVAVAAAPVTPPPVVVPARPAPVVSVPPAAPPRMATGAPPGGAGAATGELMQLRTEIAQLHREVQALPPPKPAVITNLVVAAANPPPPAPVPMTHAVETEPSADELVLAQARRMFNKAMERAGQLDAEELDGELATIQTMAPDFLPAILERAQRLQQRQLNAAALAQWQNIQKLAKSPDLQARAAQAIGQVQAALSAPRPALTAAPPERAVSPAPPVKVAGTAPKPPAPLASAVKRPARLPRTVQPVARLGLVEPQKLMAGEQYDEMRLLRITVLATGAAPLDPAALEVIVTFFDRGEKSGLVAPSRAVVPGSALRADATAPAGGPLEFQASYLVPRGFRQQEARQQGEPMRYFGYRVDLVSRGVLQDRRDHPATLLPAD